MKFRKIILCLLVVSTFMFTIETTKATDFAGKEEYYNTICNGYVAPDNPNRGVCEEYKTYLLNVKKDNENLIKDLNNKMYAVENDLAVIEAESKALGQKMEVMIASIETAEAAILEFESQIELVNEKIILKEEAIEKRWELIKERMVQLAVKANTNQYIDYIMGAADLVELIQRASSIESFTSHDNELIDTLNKEIEELDNEVAEKQRLIEQNEVTIASLETEKQALDAMYALNQQYAAQYESQMAELIAQKTEAQRLQQVANAAANKITFDPGFVGSNGLISPIRNGYISAGTWYYPGGGEHRGMDYAVPVGTNIYAPANGVVLSARTAVNSGYGGYLGNMAGYPYGGGNTLHILVEANDVVYGITFAHMSPMIVKTGQRFNQGDHIGESGNTGNSTGPHAHIEVYRLYVDFETALNYWNTYFDWVWGCGWNTLAYCSSIGCRIRPESLGWY